MSLKPGDPIALQRTTRSASTGAATAATGTPVATMVRNSVDDGAAPLTVDITNAPIYKITGTIPGGYSSGDVVQVRLAATVGGVSDSAIILTAVLDAKRVGDLHDLATGAQMDLVNSPNAIAIGNIQSGLGTAANQAILLGRLTS